MEKVKDLLKALNALRLEVDETIVDDLTKRVHFALEEEYERGISDGKIINEHGTVNWIT